MKLAKLLSLLLALALLTSLLAACGSTSTTTTASETTAEESSATETVAEESASEEPVAEESTGVSLPIVEEEVTYSFWITYAPFAAELINTETLEGMLILDTLQEMSNITFEFHTANGAAEDENFNLMIAAGDYCDILSTMESYTTGLEGAVEDELILDLADILPEACPTYWSYLTSNANTLMRAYTDSGYMPAICVLSPEVGQESIGYVLRQDWLDEFGMEMPSTLDELYEYIATAYEKKGAIFECTSTEGLLIELAYGLNLSLGDFEVIDGEVRYSLAEDNFKEYLLFMNKLYMNGLISSDFFVDTNADLASQARLDFGSGTNSLVATSAANTSDIIMNVSEDSFEMAVLPLLTLDGSGDAHVGSSYLTDTMKDTDPWCFSTTIGDYTPLLELVEYLFSEEGYLFSNYGVEGTTYTLDEDGNPQYTDLVINNPDGLSYFFASYVYVTNAASGFFPYINDLSKTYYEFNDNQWQVYEDLKTLSDCAYNYPSYAAMTTEESSQYSYIESDLTTYTSTKILEFIVGSADIETEFDDYVATQYAMGLQDMIDLKQAAYDRAAEKMAALME